MPRTLSPALIFALFAGAAGFGLAAFAPGLLNDSDTYWHIRAGEWMLAHGQVLRADVFSYTQAGAPWHTQEWLAEIVMALAWRAQGWAGIHLLFAICAGMTAGAVGFFVRRRVGFVPALLTVVLGLSCVTGSLLARPHMLALPLLAVWTCGLVKAREEERAPAWWLLGLMPLWANLHGSFVFGLALAGALGIEAVVLASDRRRAMLGWGLFLLAACAASLLTPFGIQSLIFPFKLSGMQGLGHIDEWQASDVSHLSAFVLALLTSLFVLGRGQVKIPPARLLLLLGLVWLALAHGRHQMLLGVTAPVLLAPSLRQSWPAEKHDLSLLPGIAAVCLLVILSVARLAAPATRGDDAISPVSALAHVPRFVREMPVLNDYGFGGYLIWNGIKPFIDSRADLYGDIFLQNYATIISPDKDALAANLAFHHARWTIFSVQSPVVKLLDDTPGWRRLYTDKLAVVHVREDVHP
ncbi:MAG TPA: hypothetical protein VFI23_11405 [Rhizomicrobium sp.]|nr:hypothetical protein [Rhizomicrobium sp.]